MWQLRHNCPERPIGRLGAGEKLRARRLARAAKPTMRPESRDALLTVRPRGALINMLDAARDSFTAATAAIRSETQKSGRCGGELASLERRANVHRGRELVRHGRDGHGRFPPRTSHRR